MLEKRSAGRDIGFYTSSKACCHFEDVKLLKSDNRIRQLRHFRRKLAVDLANLSFLGYGRSNVSDSLEKICIELDCLIDDCLTDDTLYI